MLTYEPRQIGGILVRTTFYDIQILYRFSQLISLSKNLSVHRANLRLHSITRLANTKL